MGQDDSLREEGPGTGLAADSGDSVIGSLVLTKSCGSGVLKGFLVLLLTDMYGEPTRHQAVFYEQNRQIL